MYRFESCSGGHSGPPTTCRQEVVKEIFEKAARRATSAAAPGRAGVAAFEALEQAVRHQALDIAAQWMALCDVAKAIPCRREDPADRWAGDRRAELDAGRLRGVVAVLRIHVETHARGGTVHSLYTREPTPHALSAVPGQGLVHLVGRRRSRLKADRRTDQARPHALDRRRGQRHHRPPLLHPQRTLRGLLGATSSKCRLTLISQ